MNGRTVNRNSGTPSAWRSLIAQRSRWATVVLLCAAIAVITLFSLFAMNGGWDDGEGTTSSPIDVNSIVLSSDKHTSARMKQSSGSTKAAREAFMKQMFHPSNNAYDPRVIEELHRLIDEGTELTDTMKERVRSGHRYLLMAEMADCYGLKTNLDATMSRPNFCLLLEFQQLALTNAVTYTPTQRDFIVDNNNDNNNDNDNGNDNDNHNDANNNHDSDDSNTDSGLQHKLQDNNRQHFVLCTDGLLPAMALINSTVSTSVNPERVVFHVITTKHTRRGLRTWISMQPADSALNRAFVHVQDMSEIDFANTNNFPIPTGSVVGARGPIQSVKLDHLQFYLPRLFPQLHRVMLLEEDIIVQSDLSPLFELPFVDESAVIMGVPDCARRYSNVFNFTNPEIAGSPQDLTRDHCTFYFGANMINLQRWSAYDLTAVYESWMRKQHESGGRLWWSGVIPPAILTFHNHTQYLERRWLVPELGKHVHVPMATIEAAGILHYSGVYKPWHSTAVAAYKPFWLKHLNTSHPLLEKCKVASDA
eukprot:TRINITY_DN4136_c0_g1_i1.p1 TRINITY_DN4136_c0_g1~~TRINITY_DN4136_c0_g1_i1.p1  ORF type:complete len:534 (-),score=81.32 TRINITY_DN4136_c0_g1_i1:11-1612(-)